MTRLKLGVRLESFKLPLRRALQEAARLAVAGAQFDAVGDLSPRSLSDTGRRELRHLLRSHNLELGLLGVPMRHGLDEAEGQEARIDYLRQTLELAFDLGAKHVVIPCSQVPDDVDDPNYRRLREALMALGSHGDRVGATLALEPGANDASAFRDYLAKFDSGGLGINVNPASMAANGFDPLTAVPIVQDRMVHVHATEAKKNSLSRNAQEVPLGHGDLDWMQMLAILEAVGYRGWLTISQDVGEDRIGDLTTSVGLLRRFGV